MAGGSAEDDGGNGRQFVPWPDWEIGDIPSLARYVSMPALDETGLPVPDRYTGADPDCARGRDIARGVYESILGLGLKYMHEPWRVESFGHKEFTRRQRVRYPAWVTRDSGGTCLDLAILYATALIKAQIRPYIAIRYFADPVRGEPEGHAFVIADLQAPLTDQDRWRPAPSPMERPASGPAEEGLLVMHPGQQLPSSLLAVDPMRATTNFPLPDGKHHAEPEGFEQAEAAAVSYLADTKIMLCDVATAQLKGYKALDRPADSSTPAIWTRLPEMPGITNYPSRGLVLERLAAARGRIVIYGPQGFGKSTLAYMRARSADGGYGWFLNAADRSTLQSQLAQAENDQQERGFRQMERLDQVPFSDLAVRRLEVSDAPWVLVLDNANGKPGEITPILPREITPNQTIIVTTTNPGWLEEWPESDQEPRTTHVVLEALDASIDMPGIDAGLRGLAGGSPLFYEAARAAIQAGARIPSAPENAVGLVWQLAQDYLADYPGALDLAHLMAWAPPVALPIMDLVGLLGNTKALDSGAADVGRRLEQAGLVRFLTQPTPSVLMHRLIAARIREDKRLVQIPGHQPVPAHVALLAAGAGQDLMTRLGDAESFGLLEAELGRGRPASVPARTWGLAVYGIARAGEIRGRSAQSSTLFEKAISYLDEGHDSSLLSECWNGRARYVKDHPPTGPGKTAALDEALSWAQKARELATEAAGRAPTGSEQQRWDLIRAERAHAMQALIMRKQADDIADMVAKKARLAEAMTMLEESETKRDKHLKALGISDIPDQDRSRFNLGGSGIGLAKLSRGAEAERYLRAAREAYEEAKRIRVGRYGAGFALPAIASCDNGIALAYYYGALLAADPLRGEHEAYEPITPESRMSLLRRASTACAEALRDRTLLAPADRDDGDTSKSDDLTVKIIQVRKLVSAQAGKQGPLSLAEAEKALGRMNAEALEEVQALGGIIEPGADGDAGQAPRT